ncbi:hypothetical protein NDU88_006007 [Pleurodeles waltl]|uniref:Uncharacterized protein n=1 Tax=Pleurodeles waltl TaxID=8319 RepID=A0AAV7LR61_PLEWA|nr:hypothetical protein NDU88_006007 [Pleurodeles waltl]
MCWPECIVGDFPSRRSGESARGRQTASPGALWRQAALELRRSRRAIAQAPIWGEAGRGRASTSGSWLSPSRPKVPLGGYRKVRRGNGVLEGPGKSSGAQLGQSLLWTGAQPQESIPEKVFQGTKKMQEQLDTRCRESRGSFQEVETP